MVQLFGREYGQQDLLKRVGDMSQLAGITSTELADGAERGVRALHFRTGGGFNFVALPDRALDIYYADYAGVPLAWISGTGAVAPAYHEWEGVGWLRGFYGGLLVTCGLSNIGMPNVDQGEELGLHGRISYVPARQVAVETVWEGNDYVLRARGTVRQISALGENLVLTRTITTQLGANWLRVADTVENRGFAPAPFLIGYHINPGFPVLDEGSTLVTASSKVTPVDDLSARDQDKWGSMPAPQAGWQQQIFHHDLRATGDGRVGAALVNRTFGGGRGLGLYVRWNKNELGHLWEWKMVGEGNYVVGIEPMNGLMAGRAHTREQGQLTTLAPRETRSVTVEIAVLTSSDTIAAAERQIREGGSA